MKLQYINANSHKTRPERRGLSVECVTEILEIVGKNEPDIIVINEFSYMGDYEKLWDGLADYNIEVSSKYRKSKATCLVLIAWKKVFAEGTVTNNRPSVVRDRFLMIQLNEDISIIGLHVPPPYANYKFPLIDRVVKEIEPFRCYVDDIAKKYMHKATIIVGDFNPYNSQNTDINILMNNYPNVSLTDSIIRMTSLYNYTSVFNEKLDYICVSSEFIDVFGRPEIQDPVKMINSDHDALIVSFLK